MNAYRALIVDFGGVLTTPLQDAMARFSEEHGIELQDLVRVALAAYTEEGDDLVVRFERGEMGDAEFALAFAQRLAQATGKEVDPERLVSRLFRGLQIEEAMVDAVRRARAAGVKTALLSNSWGLELYPRAVLEEVCDVVVISGEVGLRKPDPAIFELTTGKLDLRPQECVFVDDHPGHLRAAQTVGMTTVLHRNPAETIAQLEELFQLELMSSGRSGEPGP
ncbi:MAG: HAD family phosphatase [Actinomycetota bacterium]|nr:HAD family phosphatase [Actinomycetota bacterium]